MYKSSLRHIHNPVLSSLKMKGIRLLYFIIAAMTLGMHKINLAHKRLNKLIYLLRWPPDGRLMHVELPRHKKFKDTFLKNSCPKPIYTVHWGHAVGWATALQAGRSWFQFRMVSLGFFIDVILPAALWTWGRLSFWKKWVPGMSFGGKGSRSLELTTLPFAKYLEILWAWVTWIPNSLSRPVQWKYHVVFM
jgi:hypothetical protein